MFHFVVRFVVILPIGITPSVAMPDIMTLCLLASLKGKRNAKSQ